MWLATMLATALGVPVDDERVQSMVDALLPAVEARTGRSFVAVPRVGITNRDQLRIQLLRPSGLALGLERRVATASHDLRQLVEPLVSDALAVYVPYDERIYLVQEAFDELGQSYDLPMDVLEPLLKCVLTHELVHAQQHQYGVETAETASTQRGQKALREGHASHVAYEYCATEHGPGIVRLMETVQGIELEASLAPGDEAAVYGWGLRLAETLVAEGLLWSALNAPPPAWSDIVQAVEPTLPPDWRSIGPLRRTVAELGGELEIVESGPVSPATVMQPFLASRWGVDAMPRARGGFAVEAVGGTDEVTVLAFLLDRRGAPAKLVAGRRGTVAREGAWHGYGTDAGRVVRGPDERSFAAALRREGVSDALRIRAKIRGDGPYTEAWLATEQRLFVVMASGRRLRQRPALRTMLPMLATMTARPGAELGLVSLDAWIERVRAVEDSATLEPSWQYRLHEASRGLERGDDEACTTVFRARLLERSVVDLAGHARAAFDCAAVALDLDLARIANDIIDEAPPASAIHLASHALEEEQPALARKLLAKAAREPSTAMEIISVQIRAAVALRRWDEVEELIHRHPVLPGSVRAHAGSALYEAGRARGLEIVAAACPDLSGAERSRCVHFVEQQRSR